jgi:hypothetical protein
MEEHFRKSGDFFKQEHERARKNNVVDFFGKLFESLMNKWTSCPEKTLKLPLS